jgi:hypothetical protein
VRIHVTRLRFLGDSVPGTPLLANVRAALQGVANGARTGDPA